MKRSHVLLLLLTSCIAVLASRGLMSCNAALPEHSPDNERLLSLYPAITETLFAINGEEKLVGRSDYCTHPKEASALPSFGTALTPNLEPIAGLAPGRILLGSSTHSEMEKLKSLATTDVYPWLTLEEVAESTRRLGELVGKTEKAESLAIQYEQRLGGTPGPTAPTVLILLGGSELSKGPYWFIKSNSLHGAALHAAGYRNAVPGSLAGPPSMSVERLIEIDPDIILILGDAHTTDATSRAMIGAIENLSPLQAVQNQTIEVMRGENLLSVGPHILTFSAALQQTCDVLRSRLP